MKATLVYLKVIIVDLKATATDLKVSIKPKGYNYGSKLPTNKSSANMGIRQVYLAYLSDQQTNLDYIWVSS